MTPSRGTSPLASSKVLAHAPRLKESLKQYEDMIIAVLQKNLSSCEIKAWKKKVKLERDLNPFNCKVQNKLADTKLELGVPLIIFFWLSFSIGLEETDKVHLTAGFFDFYGTRQAKSPFK